VDDFSWSHRYRTTRVPVFARNMVATSQPVAAQAGLEMLRRGGNAIDAAVATAIALAVVEPVNNGIGSDAFAIVWDGQRLQGLNASGRAPAAWTPERFAGRERMPGRGWDAVTVPGAVSAWAALSERYGRLSFAELFEPAVSYARQGWLVPVRIAELWALQEERLADVPGFREAFLPPPRPGVVFRLADQAETLEAIAATRGEAFYRGALAERMVAHARAHGGALALDDLAAHRADWVEPIGVDYHGVRLHEIPPNGQGIAALIALGVLRHLDLPRLPVDAVEAVHLQIEAVKLAWNDVERHVGDGGHMKVSVVELLDDDRLAALAGRVDPQGAAQPRSRLPGGSDTVYLSAADADGRMVSYIQSNFRGFGSGIVVPGTGISLQNRGSGFVLEPGHPNRVAPGKRPFHTIIPGFLTRDGRPLASFGVMGGHFQAQGHVQMVVRTVDHGQDPQAAADAPRWFVQPDGSVWVEAEAPADWVSGLRARGHAVEEVGSGIPFGGAQTIWRLEDGYCAASEPRKDGQAVGY